MADRDKGKEKALEPLEGTNIIRIKRRKIENTSDGQKKENLIERTLRRMDEEKRLRKMKMDAEAAGKKEAEEDADEYGEALDGTETEDTTEESEVEEEKTVLSPRESSTNHPKGMKMNVELAAGNNQDEELILSRKESSTNNPKDMKMKRVREEDDQEEEEDKEKKLKAADSLSDTGTSKFPTSPIDKFMDSSDKDDQSMQRSPPGDL